MTFWTPFVAHDIFGILLASDHVDPNMYRAARLTCGSWNWPKALEPSAAMSAWVFSADGHKGHESAFERDPGSEYQALEGRPAARLRRHI